MRSHGVLVLLLFLFSSMANGQDEAYEMVLDTIFYNLDEGNPIDNETYIQGLTNSTIFKEFNCYQRGKLLHYLGVSYFYERLEYRAIKTFKNVLDEHWKDCAEASEIERANTMYNIGISYQYTTDVQSGTYYIDRALNMLDKEEGVDPLELAFKYMGAAKYYYEKDDFLRAETGHLRAEQLFESNQADKVDKLENLNGSLILYLKFKKFDKAERLFQRIEKYIRSEGLSTNLQAVVSYINGAGLASNMENYELASKRLDRIQNVSEADNSLRSYIHEIRGKIAESRGDYARAKKEYIISSQYMSDRSDKELYILAQSYSLENISEILFQEGDVEGAIRYIDSAIQLITPSIAKDQYGYPMLETFIPNNKIDLIRQLEIKATMLASQMKLSKGRFDECLLAYYKIDTIVNQALTDITFESSKLEMIDLVNKGYRSAIDVLIQDDIPLTDIEILDHLFYFSSRAKAIVLQKELEGAQAIEDIMDSPTAAREDSIKERIALVQKAMQNENEDFDSLQQLFYQAQTELNILYQSVDDKNPAYAKKKLSFRAPPNIVSLQRELDPNTAIVDYFILDKRLISTWVTRDTAVFYSIAYDEDVLDRYMTYVSDADIEDGHTDGQALYDILIAKGLNTVAGDIGRYYFIPHQRLLYLPFEALIDSEGQYLVECSAMQYAYTSSMLLDIDEETDGDFKYGGFGTSYSKNLNKNLADAPIAGADIQLSPLYTAQEEIKRAAQIFDGELFLEKDALLSNFIEKANDFDILHLSLHGIVNFDDPNQSCILFDDRNADFVLSPHDLYAHPINARLAILSACHSATGSIYRGEGVSGMTRSFLTAGADNVLSSLWAATENSSTSIVPAFLRGIREQKSMPEALREAKLSYIKDASPNYRHPYYWANFVLIGDIPPGISQSPLPQSYKIWAFALAAIVLGLIFFFLNRRKAN